MEFVQEPRWLLANQQRRLPLDLASWLLDEASLTARLIAHSDNSFQVRVLVQGWGKARPSELRVLQASSRQKILVREVILMGRGEHWVFARSLIPYTSMTGRLKALKKLDNRPLGALIFQDPAMHRDPIEVAAIDARHAYVSPACAPRPGQQLWGRRSVFYLDRHPLLVSEVFLPGFCASL